jgi:NAD(P)-dependent dehydrogenase (short-subunit alcohol dehydrogenase family)
MWHCESYLHHCTDFARLATLADWEKIFAVNVTGVFLSYKYAAQKMIALNGTHKRGRRIIGASSLVGKRGMCVHPWVLTLHKLFRTGEQYLSAYSASKFAVRGITQSAGMLSIYIVFRRF